MPAGKLEQSRRQRAAIGADQVVAIDRIRIGQPEIDADIPCRTQHAFDLDTLRFDAAARAIGGTGARQHACVAVGSVQRIAAAFEVCDLEIDPVERVQLELAIGLIKGSHIDVEPAPVELEAKLIRIDTFRFELKIGSLGPRVADRVGWQCQASGTGRPCRGLGCPHRSRVGGRISRCKRIAWRVECRCIEIETASLEAAREGAIDQQILRRLVAEHRRSRELAFRALRTRAGFGKARPGIVVDRAGGSREWRRDVAERGAQIVVGIERRRQILAFMRVTATERKRQFFRDDVDHIVREEGIISAVLPEGVADDARIGQWPRANRSGKIDEIGARQRSKVAIRVRAELRIVGHVELLVRIIGADQPVEPPAEQLPLQTSFLREQLEFAREGRAMENVEAHEILILALRVLVVAISRDRGQLDAAEIPVELARSTIILAIRAVVEARCCRNAAIERRTNADVRTQRIERGKQRICRNRHIAGCIAAKVAGRAQIWRGTTDFVALRIVADQANAEIAGRLEQQLAADQIAVAIVRILETGRQILGEAVTLLIDSVKPAGDLVGKPARDGSIDTVVIIVAICGRAFRLEIEARLLGHDVDQARCGILAEQRALRPAQHFHALDIAEFGQAHAGAAAVHAVNEEADRRLQSRVFANGSDTTNARGEADLARRAGHQQ